MTTMTGKEVLRAIADGADIGDFEIELSGERWETLFSHTAAASLSRCNAKFRRKPRTRVVNGFTVPAPIQEMPEDAEKVFCPDIGNQDWYFFAEFHSLCESDVVYFNRGLLFSTKEAAIANAKAMCGIDPNGDA